MKFRNAGDFLTDNRSKVYNFNRFSNQFRSDYSHQSFNMIYQKSMIPWPMEVDFTHSSISWCQQQFIQKNISFYVRTVIKSCDNYTTQKPVYSQPLPRGRTCEFSYDSTYPKTNFRILCPIFFRFPSVKRNVARSSSGYSCGNKPILFQNN